MLDEMDRIGRAMERVSELGYALAVAIRLGKFSGSIERAELDRIFSNQVESFHAAWDEAVKVATYPGRPANYPPRRLRTEEEAETDAVRAGTLYMYAGLYSNLDQAGLSERDPRRLLSFNPLNSQSPRIEASVLETTCGQIGHVARLLRSR
jgi:hypothetical protein